MPLTFCVAVFMFLSRFMLFAYRFEVWFAIYICAVALTQLLGAKTFIVRIVDLDIQASASLLLLPFVFGMLDPVIEVLGRERANAVACASVCTTIFVVLVSAFVVALPASTHFSPDQTAYVKTFGGSLRFAITSILSFFCLQLLDVRAFVWIREQAWGRSLALKVALAALLGLVVDTFVFTVADRFLSGLPLVDNILTIFSVAFPYTILRWLVACLGVPLAYLGVRFLKSNVC